MQKNVFPCRDAVIVLQQLTIDASPCVREKHLSSLKTLIGGNDGRLASLAREAERRAGLTRSVTASLPADLQPHVLHVSVSRDGQATVTVDSAAWATRLRYEQQCLVTALSAEGLETTRVIVKVLPRK
jgi:hypothetical protein